MYSEIQEKANRYVAALNKTRETGKAISGFPTKPQMPNGIIEANTFAKFTEDGLKWREKYEAACNLHGIDRVNAAKAAVDLYGIVSKKELLGRWMKFEDDKKEAYYMKVSSVYGPVYSLKTISAAIEEKDEEAKFWDTYIEITKEAPAVE